MSQGEQTRLEEAVAYMVRAIVAKPDDVEIEQTKGQRGPILQVRLDARDRGRLIGRQGRTIQAMRAVLGAGALALDEGEGGVPTVEVIDEGDR